MNLKKQRDEMRQSFEDGAIPELIKKYKIERDNENWRSSKIVEELCEYALFLIDRHDTLD